jgi:hypothetical protein
MEVLTENGYFLQAFIFSLQIGLTSNLTNVKFQKKKCKGAFKL